MAINQKEPNSSKVRETLSNQITFRHSSSVKTFIDERVIAENLGDADVCRRIFNAGLKAEYGKDVRGNSIVN